MKAKSRNTLRVPGWFKRRKEGVRSHITHKIYQSFAPGLISIKISNTRRIDSKIELLFNQFAIWLMREQIVTEPIWRQSHPSRVRGLKWPNRRRAWCSRCRTLRGCVDWNITARPARPLSISSHPSRVRGLKSWFITPMRYWFPVAPFAGAWIEIVICIKPPLLRSMSHPSRVRGLKF